ncbi:hypothetical protein HAX54_022056 [Datura stramonium]|uniref:Uncharacterized protein n=1 Tax=Datura stramonium TaxID=4076 RepID=A0ABS8S3U9_DATST|nr:hypothetical protein [Datura stramonium]
MSLMKRELSWIRQVMSKIAPNELSMPQNIQLSRSVMPTVAMNKDYKYHGCLVLLKILHLLMVTPYDVQKFSM